MRKITCMMILALLASPVVAQSSTQPASYTPSIDEMQTAAVGFIKRITELERGHPEPVERTSRASFLRYRQNAPVFALANVQLEDLIRLNGGVYLDLQFNRNIQTRAVVGPSSFLGQQGIYEILEDGTSEVKGLKLVIRQGRMVVEHEAGRLEVWAAGIRTQIFGTTVLFDVASGDSSGVLYLKEGHIGFTEFGIIASGKNRAWELVKGERPREIRLTGRQRRNFRQDVKHDGKRVWRKNPKPFFKRAPVWITGAILVGGGTYWVLTSNSGDPTGSITINIPGGS